MTKANGVVLDFPKPRRARGGKDLWMIARGKVLPYRTIEHIVNRGMVPRRMSVMLDQMQRAMRSFSHVHTLRRMKYGRGARATLRQVWDEYMDMITTFCNGPVRRGNYIPWWTIVSIAVNMAIFFFMAAEWRVIEREDGWEAGPKNMVEYLRPTGKLTAFSTDFLIVWGGRDLRRIVNDKEWWRWLQSSLAHSSIRHLGSNMIMTCFYGVLTERVYGARIVIPVWLVSAFGGNMLSAALERPCDVVVGASGGVFGYLGMFIADTIVRWRRLRRPLIRVVILVLILAQFGFSIANDTSVSHFSHIGGLACGACFSVILLPDIENKLLHNVLPVVCGMVVTVSVAVLPIYVYNGLPEALRACEDGRGEALFKMP